MSVHTFDPLVAAEFGIAEAVIIKNFQFWIQHNLANGTHHNDGRTWTYNSARALQKLFPYMGKKQIYGALTRLEAAGVLMVGNYNRTGFDRTTWYAFVDEARWIAPPADTHLPKRENGSPRMGQPIPDGKKDVKPDGNQSPAQAREGVFIVGVDGLVMPPVRLEIPEIPVIPPPEKPEPPPRPAGPKPPDTDWQRWVDRYEVHVKAHNDGIGHHWTKVQLGPQGLKGVRTHLVKVSTKAEGRTDDDCGFAAWCYVLDHWRDLGDDWLQKQFDLCVLLKKITDILNRLKNGSQTTGGTPAGRAGKQSTSQARDAALRDY